jgi:hypothetical protein
LTTQVSGGAPLSGAYTVNAFISYYVNGVHHISASKYAQFNASVPNPPSPGPGPGTSKQSYTPTPKIPGININSLPVALSAAVGGQLSSIINLQSISNVTEIINFTVSNNYTGIVTLSPSSITLLPGQKGSVVASIRATSSMLPGTYVIPITMNASFVGDAPASQTAYVTFTIYSNLKNGLQVLGQSYMVNNLTELSGAVSISNNGESTITNGTLTTMLPLSIAANLTEISAYGLPNNITRSTDGYAVNWNVQKILPGQILYAYYTIHNPSSASLAYYPQNIFTLPTPPVSSQVLKIISISAPTFYSNSTNKINATVFYAGSTYQPVSFSLSGPPGVTIYNSTQVVYTSPNRLLNRSFSIFVGNYTGTLLFYLTLSAGGLNNTETLPAVVLTKIPIVSPPSQKPFLISFQTLLGILEAFAGAALIFIILLVIINIKKRQRAPESKTRELVKMAKRIRGEIDE